MTRNWPAFANACEPRIGSMKRVDLAADQVLVRGRRALVRHDQVVDPGRRRSNSVERWPADAAEPIAKVSLPGLALACEIRRLDVGDRQVLVDRDGQRRLGDEGDRRKVLDDVEGRGLHRHRRRRHRRRGEEQGVAVRLGVLDRASRRSCRRRPGRLSTTNVWPVCSPSFCGELAADEVERAARRERDDDRHRLGRIGLRPRARNAGGECNGRGRAKESSDDSCCLLVNCDGC